MSQQDNYIVGVGSGSTIVYAVERLGEYWRLHICTDEEN
jgi:ribose 5-phosphate isomerase